ncbi:hypothetical protein DB347_22645 [Opitutaceae bacterium EW11]|nr:hypothetical protein DB347_22645 [Opitutaceae bacterium EW11]
MALHADPILENRPLNPEERRLIEWLLTRVGDRGARLIPEVDRSVVFQRCSCGCASVDLTLSDTGWPPGSKLEVISDSLYRTPRGNLCGAFVFTVCERLGGLELWSVDGREMPADLPRSEALFPFEEFPGLSCPEPSTP